MVKNVPVIKSLVTYTFKGNSIKVPMEFLNPSQHESNCDRLEANNPFHMKGFYEGSTPSYHSNYKGRIKYYGNNEVATVAFAIKTVLAIATNGGDELYFELNEVE